MIITRNDYNTMPEQVQENKENINLLDNAMETAQTEIETSKPVYAGVVQSLTPEEQARARSNIGAGASGFSGDYNDLVNQPIENADLNNIVGETAGHTYRHTGTTNATFVKGYLYFWTGTAWKLISNFNDLKQAQDDIATLNNDVQTIDNNKADKDAGNLSGTDVPAWKSALGIDGKAEKDASNLSSSNVDSWQNKCGFERVETVYDKDSADPNINWGYTSNITPGASITGKDFTKYKALRFYCWGGYRGDVIVADLTNEHDGHYFATAPIGAGADGAGVNIQYFYISIKSNKTEFSFSAFNYYGTSYTNYSGYISKIEGVY